MRLVVSKRVVSAIDEFYLAAMRLHDTLDINTVLKKKQRLLESLEFLTIFPEAYGYARVRKEWCDAGYRVFISEDFYFAYTIRMIEGEEPVVLVVDAVHSLLNHE